MLAKLVVWAPSRAAAIERMKRALDDFVLLGVRTNIEFLRRVISTDDFASGTLDTGFLDRHRELFVVPEGVPIEAILAASLESPIGTSRQDFQDAWTSGASGRWRNS